MLQALFCIDFPIVTGNRGFAKCPSSVLLGFGSRLSENHCHETGFQPRPALAAP